MWGQKEGRARPQAMPRALAYRREGAVQNELDDGLEVLLELLEDVRGLLHLNRAACGR